MVHRHPAAVQRNDVVLPDLLQIREAGNHRGLLTAKRQVDEVLDMGQVQLVGHGLELGGLFCAEAVQPLRQIVQLIHIDQRVLEHFQYAVRAVQFIHHAVPISGKAQLHRLEHFDGLIVLVIRDREGNSGLTILRVLGIV